MDENKDRMRLRHPLGQAVSTTFVVTRLIVVCGVLCVLNGCCSLRSTKRIQVPGLRHGHVVVLRPAEIRANAHAGMPIEIPLGRRNVQVRVRVADVLAPGAQVIRVTEQGPQRIQPQAGINFVGEVASQTGDSEVRLTITDQNLEGYIRVGKDWWFIQPLREFSQTAAFDEFLVYRARDLRIRRSFGDDVLDHTPPLLTARTQALRATAVPSTIGILLFADGKYSRIAEAVGSSAYVKLATLLHHVNGVYQKRVGTEFVMQACVIEDRANQLTDTSCEGLLDQFRSMVDTDWGGSLDDKAVRQELGVEVVHLATGKDLKGDCIGMAERHGGYYSLSQQIVAWGSGGGIFGGPPNFAYTNMLTAAHELGHNFDGRHDEADEWCVTSAWFCFDYVRTIMWPTLYEDNRDQFSDGSRKRAHNNLKRLQENMMAR